MDICLTPGQTADIKPAADLIRGKVATNILADKGYDFNEFIELIEVQSQQPVIPPRCNRLEQREYDRHTYKERHLVEVFFNKIKHFRRVSTRYEKLARNYLAFVQFASCMVWLRF